MTMVARYIEVQNPTVITISTAEESPQPHHAYLLV